MSFEESEINEMELLKKVNIHEVCPDVLHTNLDTPDTASTVPSLDQLDSSSSADSDEISSVLDAGLKFLELKESMPVWPHDRIDKFYPESDHLPWHFSYIDEHMVGMSAPVSLCVSCL